jgi:GNAT superfamily N-acetyltransferase
VREWDPGSASDTQIEAVLRTINDGLADDVPEDPPWQANHFREYLAVTMPGERRASWLALADDDSVLGHATMLLLDDIGVLELAVRPDARRRGAGTALLAAVARRASEERYESIGVEVIGATPAVDFYAAYGFRCAFVEVRNVLDLGGVDWLRLGEMARGIGAGYRVEYHPGGPPAELLEAYATAKESARDLAGDLDLRPSSYDADRLRASLATLHARGLRPYIVVGLHEASGKIAGLTEVVVAAQRPSRADQYDTVVVPAHRGYGLGRALKARMLLELRGAEKQLVDVQTWNAVENEPMLRVNTELGFEPDRQWWEYEADVAQLVRRLAAA